MKTITIRCRQWWSFPLAFLVSLVLFAVIAAGSARAQDTSDSTAGLGGNRIAVLAGAVSDGAASTVAPIRAMPKAATPAQAYMALGILFLLAALAIMTLGWRDPQSGSTAGTNGKGWRNQGRALTDD